MRSRSSHIMQRFALVCLHAQIAVHALDEFNSYFDYGKNLKTPKFSPMPGSKWHRFLCLWLSGQLAHNALQTTNQNKVQNLNHCINSEHVYHEE